MPPKGVLKINVTDCAAAGVISVAITEVLTVESVIKTCCKKRGLEDGLPWWLVVSEAGEDSRSAGVREPPPLLIADVIEDATSAGKDASSLVWTLLQDAAATAQAKEAAEAKAKRAEAKRLQEQASKAAAPAPAAPSVPANFKNVAAILTKIGCFSVFKQFQEEDLDDSTLDDLADEYLVAAGLTEAQAKLFIAELRGGSSPAPAAAAAITRGSVGSAPAPASLPSVDCNENFKSIAGALSRIGCSGFLQRFIDEEIDDSMLGDLEQEHLIDLGMSVQQ